MNRIFRFASPAIMLCLSCCGEERSVKVTVRGENGLPIEGVQTTVTFLGYSGGGTQRKIGLTDSDGEFEALGEASLRMHVLLEKEGYYESKSGRLDRNESHDLEFVLRKVRDPIPLYAMRAHIGFPKNREWLGYDFESGDWVAPNGGGRVVDVWLRCDTQKTAERDGEGTVEMRFPDGGGLHIVKRGYLKRSLMKLPHVAPVDGYMGSYSRREESYHNERRDEDLGYFFRSRVKMEGGRLVSANYGKIVEDFRFSPVETGWHDSHKNSPKFFGVVSFAYYFNPTPNERNLEFDPRRNLFTDLGAKEVVRAP